jgi:hypothetical protein
MLHRKDFVEFYKIFVCHEKMESYAIERYSNLTHFLILWSLYMKHRFVPLVGPKWTPLNAKIGTKKNRAKMILPYQEKALKHVPLCTKVGLLANCFATHLNVQKNDKVRFQIIVEKTKKTKSPNLPPWQYKLIGICNLQHHQHMQDKHQPHLAIIITQQFSQD